MYDRDLDIFIENLITLTVVLMVGILVFNLVR